jgi:serine/threonine protein kinase
MPHDASVRVCPSTGRPLRDAGSERALKVQAPLPVVVARPPMPSVPAYAPPPAAAAPSRDADSGRDLVGTTVNEKYLVTDILGRGGMGTVFEAEHLALGRKKVAVKVLHPNQAAKKNSVLRFHQEARAAGAIGHPNICEVYDLGTLADGRPYLVMEKLVGETLADRIAVEGGLAFDSVLDALIQVLSALVVTHHKGIVHRDIKPENVFLTERVGCPPLIKLLDFGVSKMMTRPVEGQSDDGDLTRIGMVMGTPHYMAPEQARGDRDLDGRVDLYACGVILYEALTGRRPFSAPNYNALLMQILTATPRPASQLRPALPAPLEAVIERAMARNREERFGTATDMQRELQSLRERLVVARSTPPPPLDARSPPERASSRPAAAAPVETEPPPSSIEIPISFGGDTVPSGESAASEDDPTTQMVRPTPKGP